MNERYFTSFLDIIACALGAAILLFLIGVHVQESFVAVESDDTLLVRCDHIGGAPAVVGIEFQKEGEPWTLANTALDTQNGYAVASASKTEKGMVSLLILFKPKVGKWKFRPVLMNFAGPSPEEETKVTLAISGTKSKYLTQNTFSTLSYIGQKGETVTIQVME